MDQRLIKNDAYNVEPILLFIWGSGGTSKSYFVKVMYNSILKSLLHHCKDPEKPRVLSLGPTGISVVNIDVSTIHCDLGCKLETKLLGSNDKSKVALRNTLWAVELLTIEWFFMVSRGLWTDIDTRLGEIIMMIPKKVFAGLSVMVVADLFQLPPLSGKHIFSQISDKGCMKDLLGFKLRCLFRYAGLTEVVKKW